MSDTTETAQEPVAWLHEIVEPTEHAAEMLSRRPGNPWRHWIDSYKKECVYRATPLYAASPAPTAVVDAEPIYQEELHDGMWQDVTKGLYEDLIAGKFRGGAPRIVYGRGVVEALLDCCERMERARRILTDDNPRPDCNWGMLDTSKARALLKT